MWVAKTRIKGAVHEDRSSGRRETKLGSNLKWNDGMLNQHMTCAIARHTWVDSDGLLNLRQNYLSLC